MTYSYTQISQYLTCPRRYRHRYLDGWKEKDTRAAMLFGRAFEQALGALFRREDPGAVLFAEWSACQSQDLHYSNRDSWDRMLRQGLMLLNPVLPGQSCPGPPASTESADQVHPAHRRQERLRCLYRRHRHTRWQALPAGVEDQSPSRYPEEPEGLLSLDPQLVCYSWITGIAEVAQVVFVRKTPGRGSVPAHHHHRGTAPGVWPPGGRHDPSNRVGGLPATQWHPLSPEPLQQLSVCGPLSWKAGNDRRRRGAASRSRQS